MIRRGHDVTLLCPAEARIYEEANARGVPVSALPIGRKTLAGVIALRRWLKRNSADVINTHSSTDTWLAALATRFFPSAPPIIRTRHISAPVPRNLPTRWLYTSATRYIVTTGEKLREQLVHENRFPPDRIISIPTGIDTGYFIPGVRRAVREQLGLDSDAPIIGIVATLRSWKGHQYLLDAFPKLANDSVRLVIVGDGPQREAIAQKIADLGISARVVMTGNQRDVLPWLQAMDVFVLPSYANEGVPQAILQAMACGLPVISTPIGSIAEAVQDEVTGLLVPARNADELLAAMNRLLANPSLRQQMGSAAMARARENFDIGRMLEKMEAVFRETQRPS